MTMVSDSKQSDLVSKACYQCGEMKPVSEFYKQRDNKTGYNSYCKVCQAAKHRERRLRDLDRYNAKNRANYLRRRTADPEKIEAQRFRAELKRRYGMTPEDYERLLDEQGGLCGICRHADESRLCVDHDHETGAVRGLLCARCNAGLGLLREDPLVLDAAKQWLERK